jgi:hypothetical protein
VPVQFQGTLRTLMGNGLIRENEHFKYVVHERKDCVAFDMKQIYNVCDQHPDIQPRITQQMMNGVAQAFNRVHDTRVFVKVPTRWGDQLVQATIIVKMTFEADLFKGRRERQAMFQGESASGSDEQLGSSQLTPRRATRPREESSVTERSVRVKSDEDEHGTDMKKE